MSNENLWGEIPHIEPVKTPTSILKEQAALLKEKTNALLEGRVEAGRDITGQDIARLDIVVPIMDNYSVTIVRIVHGLEFYPVKVLDEPTGVWSRASSEPEFKEHLKIIFRSDKVQNIIKVLLQRIKSLDLI